VLRLINFFKFKMFFLFHKFYLIQIWNRKTWNTHSLKTKQHIIKTNPTFYMFSLKIYVQNVIAQSSDKNISNQHSPMWNANYLIFTSYYTTTFWFTNNSCSYSNFATITFYSFRFWKYFFFLKSLWLFWLLLFLD